MILPRSINRLAFRNATVVMLAVLAAGALLMLGTSWISNGAVGLMGLTAGISAYLATYSIVAKRIALAEETLRSTRKRRFGEHDSFPKGPFRDELDELVMQAFRARRELQTEIERLEELENYRRVYVGDVSHELRTPIFAITGFAETLLDGALDDERVRRRFVEKIEAHAKRLDTLTRDLAEISRIETGGLQMARTPFDLPSLARECAEALEVLAQERGVRITIQMASSLPRVLADPMRIRQVLSNLVENAIKYNQPGGQVEMLARRVKPDVVQIAVVDDGIGIPKEALPRLTERFFRVDKSRSREQGGTGLGLAIVKHTLEAHGARLRVESHVGHGSKFSFDLACENEPTR